MDKIICDDQDDRGRAPTDNTLSRATDSFDSMSDMAMDESGAIPPHNKELVSEHALKPRSTEPQWATANETLHQQQQHTSIHQMEHLSQESGGDSSVQANSSSVHKSLQAIGKSLSSKGIFKRQVSVDGSSSVTRVDSFGGSDDEGACDEGGAHEFMKKNSRMQGKAPSKRNENGASNSMRIRNNLDRMHQDRKRVDLSKLVRIYKHRSHYALTNFEKNRIRAELMPPPVGMRPVIFWLRVLLSFLAYTATRIGNAIYVFYLLGEGISRFSTLDVTAPEYSKWQPNSVRFLSAAGIAVAGFEVLVVSMFLIGVLWSVVEMFVFRGSSVPYYRSHNLRRYVRRLNFSLLQFGFSIDLITKIVSNTFTRSMNSFTAWNAQIEYSKIKFRGSFKAALFSALTKLISFPVFFLPIILSMLVVPVLALVGSLAVLLKTMHVYQFAVRKNIVDWGAVEYLLLIGFVNQLSNAGSGGRFPREQFLQFYDDMGSTIKSIFNKRIGPRVAAPYAPSRQGQLEQLSEEYVHWKRTFWAFNIACFFCVGWIPLLYKLVVNGIIRFTSDVDTSNAAMSATHYNYSPILERITTSLIDGKILFFSEVFAALYIEVVDQDRLERTIKLLHFLDLSSFVQYDVATKSLPMTDCDHHVVSRKSFSSGVSIKIVKKRTVALRTEYEIQVRNPRSIGYVVSNVLLPVGVSFSDCSEDYRSRIIEEKDVFVPPKTFDYMVACFSRPSKESVKLQKKCKPYAGELLRQRIKGQRKVHVREWEFGNQRVITLYNAHSEYRTAQLAINAIKNAQVKVIISTKQAMRGAVNVYARKVIIPPYEEVPYAIVEINHELGEFAVPYRMTLHVEQGRSLLDHRKASHQSKHASLEKEMSHLSIQSI